MGSFSAIAFVRGFMAMVCLERAFEAGGEVTRSVKFPPKKWKTSVNCHISVEKSLHFFDRELSPRSGSQPRSKKWAP